MEVKLNMSIKEANSFQRSFATASIQKNSTLMQSPLYPFLKQFSEAIYEAKAEETNTSPPPES